MWPTPTTQEIEHKEMTLTPKGRRLSKDGKSSHSINLADSVKMWPTPTASGARSKGSIRQMRQKVYLGEVTREEAEAMIGGSLEPARMKKMFPTVQARDWKGASGRSMKGMERDLPKPVSEQGVSGQLNPTWVEWLMGYPEGWTELKD
jgi:hypothetical protein